MSRLSCPFCGPRELQEFRFHKTVPAAGGTELARVYERVGDPDLSIEHWQHRDGCRAWLCVRRNPSDGHVLAVALLDGSAA